jgi:alpha-galactosidase
MAIQAVNQGWVIETQHSAYALGINSAGRLAHAYWGARLPNLADYPSPPSPGGWASFNNPEQLTPEEYPGYGGMKFTDPCLKVTFADGVRDVVLRFERAEISADGEQLDLLLCDVHYPLHVSLHYRAHSANDLIERWVTLANQGQEPVSIERAFSAEWHLPHGSSYRFSHLTGRWLDENHLRREVLTEGLKVIESRRITTSHHHAPWFAIDRGTADEDQGEVWFGLLAWSGNWKLTAEVTNFSSTRVNLGLNDWDFAWRLEAGADFHHPLQPGRVCQRRVWTGQPQACTITSASTSAARAGTAPGAV